MPAASTSEAFASIFLEFGLLLLGLGILARVAHVLSISAVPLYLIAGLFFGDGGIVGITASDTFVSTIAELGVVLLEVLKMRHVRLPGYAGRITRDRRRATGP